MGAFERGSRGDRLKVVGDFSSIGYVFCMIGQFDRTLQRLRLYLFSLAIPSLMIARAFSGVGGDARKSST